MTLRTALAVTCVGITLGTLGLVTTARAATLHVLTGDNTLVQIDTTTLRATRPVPITGAPAPIMSVALRPSNGMLYGLTNGSQLVTIDPKTGQATAATALDKPVDVGARAAINFNPTVDRLRVVGLGGGNYRINVDTGAVTVDGKLAYAPATPYAATPPALAAAAYTNHMAGAKETMLYTIDAVLAQINLQAPPNDGVQQPKKQLDGILPRGMGFDIVVDAQGANTGYMLVDATLMRVALPDLTITTVGTVQGLAQSGVTGMAAQP